MRDVVWAVLTGLVCLLPMALYGFAPLVSKCKGGDGGLWSMLCKDVEYPSDSYQRLSDKQRHSLTFAAFSVTGAALMANFITQGVLMQNWPWTVPWGFVFTYFGVAYILLRHRAKVWADYFSDALLDSGLFCILVSFLWLYLGLFGGWEQAPCFVKLTASVVFILSCVFVAYMSLHIKCFADHAEKARLRGAAQQPPSP